MTLLFLYLCPENQFSVDFFFFLCFAFGPSVFLYEIILFYLSMFVNNMGVIT